MNKSFLFEQKENDPQQWYWFQEGLSKEEVNQVIKLASELPIERATTLGDDGEVMAQNDPNGARSSMVKWIPQSDDWNWLYVRMMELAKEANDETWNFDLISADENIQYTEYYANENGHYDWHQDVGPGDLASKRKVSITLQLSEDDEYVGGDLEITGGGSGSGVFETAHVCPRGKGITVIFPSYMMHRVSPVTKGTRRSLVLWVGGSHYR
jgi:PKHD-type hydroxylase